MGKILTIGIPVYNMEKYLDRCLSSVTGIRDLDKVEIIVVNDGSKDRSLEIARAYEQRFPESVRVIDKPNGGWGSGITLSIKEATGKYYKSLDSDDSFDTRNLEKYLDELESVDADILLTPFIEIDEDGRLLAEKIYDPALSGMVMPLEEYIERNGGFSKTIHSVTYRTSLLKDNNIVIWDRFYGDIDYINSPLPYVRTIYVSKLSIYRYLIGREGQSISVTGYRRHIDDYINVSKKLIRINASLSETTPANTKNYLNEDTLHMTVFAYKLMLNPKMCGNEAGIKSKLREYDKFIRANHSTLYRKSGITNTKFGISPIKIWRLTGINLYKIFEI